MEQWNIEVICEKCGKPIFHVNTNGNKIGIAFTLRCVNGAHTLEPELNSSAFFMRTKE